MSKSFYILMIVNLLLTCNAFAEKNNLKYSLSFVQMGMDYNEYYNGIWQDGESANLTKIIGYDMNFGFLFNRSSESVNEIYVDIMQLGGYSAYDGFTRSGHTPLQGTTSNQFIDASLAYKYTYRYDRLLDLYAGVGIGYHSWDRKLSSIQEELYEWNSIRPSIGANIKIQQFDLGMFVEYQYGFNATMSASDTGDKYKLGGADVVVVGFPLRYNYDRNLEFFAQYTLSTQTIKQSNVVNTLLEPDSTSQQNYFKIGATFKF